MCRALAFEGNSIRNYSLGRRLWEQLQRLATPTSWPVRLAENLGVAHTIGVEHHDVQVASSLGSAPMLRIAFASDFHAGPFTSERDIDDAIKLLVEARPDVLLLGGDFVSLRSEYAKSIARRLGKIAAPFGRYAVLGNHDYWADGAGVAKHLQNAGIDMLTNRNVRLPEPFENVSICGLDDHTSGEPDADAAFSNSTEVRVVLMHAPSGLMDIGDRSFTVALCGHTHGGQIALPNGRPMIVGHGPLSRHYNAGRFAVAGERTLIVSRGVGCTALPIRFNAAPAILTCTLHGPPVDAK